jgi:hypothetical protein
LTTWPKAQVEKGNILTACHTRSIIIEFAKESKFFFWFKGKQVNSGYHSEMNPELLTRWFINNFNNYVEEGSLFFVDNNSCLSVRLNTFPSSYPQ